MVSEMLRQAFANSTAGTRYNGDRVLRFPWHMFSPVTGRETSLRNFGRTVADGIVSYRSDIRWFGSVVV